MNSIPINMTYARTFATTAADGYDLVLSQLITEHRYNHTIKKLYSATEIDLTDALGTEQNRPGNYIDALWHYKDIPGILHICFRRNSAKAEVNAYSISPELAEQLLDKATDHCPLDEIVENDEIVCEFWRYSPSDGPRATRRKLDSVDWKDIQDNYPNQPGLDHLMTNFRPGVGGQLILWQGPPGSGKTTALRGLGSAWREWAELHYIVDPEVFFGATADYMMRVLIEGSSRYNPWDILDDDDSIYAAPENDKWRLVILEDCGEMIQADAKQETGQALSRLLNTCDGLIGRGLKFLILVTTNEEVGKLHEAVSRPGRCAAKVEFKTFSQDEANLWLKYHGSKTTVTRGQTLASLYGIINEFSNKTESQGFGFS